MRSLGSISSELCEMQRLRDKNIALGVKDAEWQRRITLARNNPQQNDLIVNPNLLSPPRRPLSLDQSHFNPNMYSNRDGRVYAVSSPQKTPMAPLSTYAIPPPATNQLNFSMPILRPNQVSVPMPVDTQTVRTDVFESTKPEPNIMDMSKIPGQELLNASRLAVHNVSPGRPSSPGGRSSTPSASTNAHSPELDDPIEAKKPLKKKPRSHTRGVGKIRRHRMTKEEEARFDPRDLVDLRGSTAAQSRKMTDHERDVMLHKRRLRNRQSAARSRGKQRKTIGEVGEEVDELLAKTEEVKTRCQKAEQTIAELRAANESLRRENDDLKTENAELKHTNTELKATALSQSPVMRRSGSTLRFSFSTDMLDKLDKIIGGSTDGLIPSSGDASNIYRIPSKLRLSLSTDKLADGYPAMSGPLPALSRNTSVTDRLLDYANNNNNNSSNNIDSLEINTDVEVKKE